MRGAGIVLAGVLLAPAAARGGASVHSVGCRTYVTTKIEISGEAGGSKCDPPKVRGGASKASARKIRNAIQGCSPAKVGGYSLLGCCKVFTRATVRVRRRGKGPRPGYNQIEITTDPDYVSCVDGTNSGIWSTGEQDEVYAHEAGHLLGLDDQYSEQTDANGNRVTPVLPGHEMDKMGAPGGKLGAGIAARDTLDMLLLSKGARCPARCCHPGTSTTTTTLPGMTICCFIQISGGFCALAGQETCGDQACIDGFTSACIMGGSPPATQPFVEVIETGGNCAGRHGCM